MLQLGRREEEDRKNLSLVSAGSGTDQLALQSQHSHFAIESQSFLGTGMDSPDDILLSMPQTLVKVPCKYCGVIFARRLGLYNYKKKLGQKQYCSRRCAVQANPQKVKDVAARFWAKVKKTKTCWIWTAATVYGGYGAFYYKGKMIHAERASYDLHVGKLRAGIEVLQKCKNPSCVRPAHLLPGTHADKLRGRAQVKSHAVLKVSDVRAIRARLAMNEKHGEIAKDFHVVRATITAINTGRNWADPAS
jgi:hypothetical protein